MFKITKYDIHIVSTPIKPRTRISKLGFRWVDDDGKVIREIAPTPPCKQYVVIHPPKFFCTGVDFEEFLSETLENELAKIEGK